MKLRSLSLAAVVLLLIFVVSCGGDAPKEPTTTTTTEETTTTTEETTTETAKDAVTLGKEIFDGKCVACHKMDAKTVGPALGDVTSRRTDEWIVKMIVDPADMLANDEDAKALLAEYNNVPMAAMGIDEEGAKNILEYLKSVNAH